MPQSNTPRIALADHLRTLAARNRHTLRPAELALLTQASRELELAEDHIDTLKEVVAGLRAVAIDF